MANARSLLKKSKKCTSGCPHLDSFLRGGFSCGSLTELVGESASGKTQLCLQLSLAVQLPPSEGGLNGSALYVYTENYFPYRRLQQIADHMFARRRTEDRVFDSNARTLRSLEVNTLASGESFSPRKVPRKLGKTRDAPAILGGATNPCNRVFIQGIQTAENLLEYLDYARNLLTYPLLMPVKIIVIDSMAALFRSDFDNTVGEMRQRVSLYFQVATKLKKYAEEFNLAIVVTNQVTDSFEAESSLSNGVFGMSGTQDHEILVTSGRRVAPALALSWAHCVNTRLFLSRSYWYGDSVKRSIQIVFAPHLPNGSCDFEVNAKGLQGLPETLACPSANGAVVESPPRNCTRLLSTSLIPVTPPHCTRDSHSTAPNSCERLFQISQSQRVVGTPPHTAASVDKKSSTILQLKLFR